MINFESKWAVLPLLGRSKWSFKNDQFWPEIDQGTNQIGSKAPKWNHFGLLAKINHFDQFWPEIDQGTHQIGPKAKF